MRLDLEHRRDVCTPRMHCPSFQQQTRKLRSACNQCFEFHILTCLCPQLSFPHRSLPLSFRFSNWESERTQSPSTWTQKSTALPKTRSVAGALEWPGYPGNDAPHIDTGLHLQVQLSCGSPRKQAVLPNISNCTPSQLQTRITAAAHNLRHGWGRQQTQW